MTQVLYTGPEGWGSNAYQGDAGIDIPIIKEQIMEPGEFYDLPSGVRVAIPEGYYGRIAARSGSLRNKRIRVYEGVIDSGYRGELFTYCEAVGPTATAVRPGDRLAQLIIQPIPVLSFQHADTLPPSDRGTRGFGSSDRKVRTEYAGVPIEEIVEPMPVSADPDVQVYVGGPIDYRDHTVRDNLINALSLVTGRRARLYDPRVECTGIIDPSVIWHKNENALDRSTLAVFLFDELEHSGRYGFGSPIEIYRAAMSGIPVVIYHNSDDVGVVMRHLWSTEGVVVATNWKEFKRVYGEELTKAIDG